MILVGAPEALAAAAALPAVSVVVVLLRFAARRYQGARYGSDDWLTLPALVLLVGMGVTLALSEVRGLQQYDQTRIGQGAKPTSNDTTEFSFSSPDLWTTQYSAFSDAYDPSFELTAKSLWAFQLIMYLMTALTKLSVLFFYRRMFWPQAYPHLGRATIATSVLVVVWTLVFFFLNIFDCGKSVELNWSPLRIYAQSSCFADIRLQLPYAATDLALNVIILLLPLPTIHGLKLDLSRRVAVGAVLLLGSTVIAASAVRLTLFVQLSSSRGSFVTGTGRVDLTRLVLHAWVTMMYWSIIEAGLALQTACLPALCILLPRRMLGTVPTGRTGSLLTQMANRAAGERGRGGAGNRTGADADRDEEAASAYPRSSGWFARFKDPGLVSQAAADASTGERNLVDSRGGMSQISHLDLDAEEDRRGRSRYREDEVASVENELRKMSSATITEKDIPEEWKRDAEDASEK